MNEQVKANILNAVRNHYGELTPEYIAIDVLLAEAGASTKGLTGCKECTDEPECAWHQLCQRKENAGFREVGVWEPDGRKFMTYAPENLNGKAMYVKERK